MSVWQRHHYHPDVRTNWIGRTLHLSAKVSFVRVLLIIRIHKKYLPMCPINYTFLISRLEHSYDRMFHLLYLHKRMASLTSLVRRYVDYILFCCSTNVATSNYGPCTDETHIHTGLSAPVLAHKHLQNESTFVAFV